MSYCGYITRLKNVRPHNNADRLLIGECFGNNVIVSLEYQENQLGVYFPENGQLSKRFCEVNNLCRIKNGDGTYSGGYLDADKRNIKAMKLRGEKSDGLFLPLTCLADFTTISDLKEGDTITVLNGEEICRKYIPVNKNRSSNGGGTKSKKPKVNFAPTFFEHVETSQLAYNLDKFHAGDVVELTLKMHGTSARTGYLPLLQPRNWVDKLLRRTRKEYGYVTGTRRVVLDANHDGGYYEDNNFRLAMAKKFEGKLHKGETVYYEIVGFVNESTPIMASCDNKKIKDKEFTKQYGPTTVFSYGCDPDGNYEGSFVTTTEVDNEPVIEHAPRCEAYVYRMTMVNEDGDVVEYSPDQMRQRCEEMAVKYVPVFERFIIPDAYQLPDDVGSIQAVNPGEYVLRKVEQYFDGPDPIGKTHIREGVVARIVSSPKISVFKHKNHTFKMLSGIAVEQLEAEGKIDGMDEDIISEL